MTLTGPFGQHTTIPFAADAESTDQHDGEEPSGSETEQSEHLDYEDDLLEDMELDDKEIDQVRAGSTQHSYRGSSEKIRMTAVCRKLSFPGPVRLPPITALIRL